MFEMPTEEEAVSHTPGPWTYSLSPSTDNTWYVDGPSRWICNSTARSSEDNARLIAAAPDLLEALGEILRAYTTLMGDDEDETMCKARAAIKKARGE